MAQLKVRVWDAGRKIMRYQDQEFFVIGLRRSRPGNEIIKEGPLFIDNIFTPEMGEVMLFTNYGDRKHHEIYQGDVVRQDNERNGDVYIGVVVQDVDGRWCLDLPGHVPTIEPSNCEVLGNLYQNPELLKQLSKRQRGK